MISIDWARLEQRVIAPGIQALNATAQYALGRAQHHAPVRAIFKRSRRGPEIARARTVNLGANTFQASGVGALRFTAEDHMRQLKRAQPRFRQVVDAGNVGRAIGHANSFEPVFRFGGKNVTGDFRLYDEKKHQLATVTATTQRRGREARTQEAAANFALSGRGRYEVRSGRAVFRRPLGRRVDTLTGTVEERFGPPRVGGRLREELYVEEATFTNSTSIWAWVVSPTPYSRFQEFGSSHNRAHPFLRPALYESRGNLRAQLRRAYR